MTYKASKANRKNKTKMIRDSIITDLKNLVEEVDHREMMYNLRSEDWQLSLRGKRHGEVTTCLECAIDLLGEALFEMNYALGELT